MSKIPSTFARLMLPLALLGAASPAMAAGDLLVAPTRIILDGERGTEVILNNIGDEEATYRISLELRRMTADGNLAEVSDAEANATEEAARAMIIYAPRKITLPPNQPQAIRIGVRPPEGLADGEYRAHMLFRAIPKVAEVTASETVAEGVSIQLTPVYGVTIPIIVRKGKLNATAAVSNPRLVRDEEGPKLAFDLDRNGNRSVYGEIRVSRPGGGEPLMMARGIAIYPEITHRTVALPITEELASSLKGDVVVSYSEPSENGGGLIADVRATLR